jgi:hypothetical protein
LVKVLRIAAVKLPPQGVEVDSLLNGFLYIFERGSVPLDIKCVPDLRNPEEQRPGLRQRSRMPDPFRAKSGPPDLKPYFANRGRHVISLDPPGSALGFSSKTIRR